jgi:glycerophosphoryl diester phosphodiesterase
MLVYGHRGGAGEAPENTLTACQQAISRGLRHVELDLRLSRDEQLVVIHDDKVNRTTFDKGKVYQFSVDELLTMDARRSAPPCQASSATAIHTLDRLMAATPELVHYNLDVKSGQKKHMLRVAELLAARFPTAARAEAIVVTSSNEVLHQTLRQLAPHIRRGYISTRLNPFPILLKHECSLLSTAWGTLNLLTVRHAHALGIEVMAWTVNDPHSIATLYRLKVDGIITDFPSMALPIVGKLMAANQPG